MDILFRLLTSTSTMDSLNDRFKNDKAKIVGEWVSLSSKDSVYFSPKDYSNKYDLPYIDAVDQMNNPRK